MENKEIINKLYQLILEYKYKDKDIEKTDDVNIFFTRRGIQYYVSIETEDDFQFGVQSIDGCGYSTDFLYEYGEWGNIDDFDAFLSAIDEKEYDFYKEIWIALDKLEEKYSDIKIEFEDIIAHKYGMY